MENMKFISRKSHAVLDYGSVVILAVAPFLFGFADVAAAKWTAMIMAALILIMSFFTDYEGGFLKTIPMAFHLSMDVIAGILLAASPWLFGFSQEIYWPHLLMGIIAIGAGLFTVGRSQHRNASLA